MPTGYGPEPREESYMLPDGGAYGIWTGGYYSPLTLPGTARSTPPIPAIFPPGTRHVPVLSEEL